MGDGVGGKKANAATLAFWCCAALHLVAADDLQRQRPSPGTQAVIVCMYVGHQCPCLGQQCGVASLVRCADGVPPALGVWQHPLWAGGVEGGGGVEGVRGARACVRACVRVCVCVCVLVFAIASRCSL